MNTEEKEVNPADVAMIAELEKKVEERVMQILRTNSYMVASIVASMIKSGLLADTDFIAQMGRKLGEREARNYNH